MPVPYPRDILRPVGPSPQPHCSPNVGKVWGREEEAFQGPRMGAEALWEVLRCAGEAQGWQGSGDLQGVAEVDCITPDTGFLAFGLPRVEMR